MSDALLTSVISTVTIVFAIGVAYGKLRGELNLMAYRMQRIEHMMGISHYVDAGDVETRAR